MATPTQQGQVYLLIIQAGMFTQRTQRGRKLSSPGRDAERTLSDRIIRFPIPPWNSPIAGEVTAVGVPHCVCYQHDVDLSGHGPYGFDTSKSQKILRETFDTLVFWNVARLQLTRRDLPNETGFYFFGDSNYLQQLNSQLNSFLQLRRKNQILERKGVATLPLPAPPLLLTLYDGHLVSGAALSRILSETDCVLMRQFYTPEAGDTLILFSEDAVQSLKTSAQREGVEFIDVGSIHELKPW